MIIDIELTNRCNATCDFCPRDNMPKMGHMRREVFHAAIDRILESREKYAVSICGTGEPSIHPNFLEFMEYGLGKGLPLQFTTNGQRITRDVAQRLVDAGLFKVTFSITGIDAVYEKIYGLPFSTVRQNILDFLEIARGRCRVAINLVNYEPHKGEINLRELKEYWRNLGVEEIQVMKITNRSGAISLDGVTVSSKEDIDRCLQQYELAGYCGVPFYSHHIGWDGNYYLCCHDWKHQAAFGNVLHDELDAIFPRKLAYFGKEDIICFGCNHYPPNIIMQGEQSKKKGRAVSREEVVSSTRDVEEKIVRWYGA